MANSGDPIEVELTAIDREGTSPPAKSIIRLIPAAIAFVALVAFAGVVWYAYNTGIREGSEFAAPVLKPEGPSKVAPQSPGGENVPHRNKQVYSLVDKSPVSTKVERFAPPPENPLPRPSANTPFEDPPAPALPAPSLKAPPPPPTVMNPPPPSITTKRVTPPTEAIPAPVKETPKAPVPTTKKPAPTPIKPEPTQKTITKAVIAPPTTTPVKRPSVAPAPVKAPPSKLTTPVVAPNPPVIKKQTAAATFKTPSGAYLIQIASLKSAESARRAWDQYEKRHKGLFAGLKLYVKVKTIKNRGVFHRVQVGPFTDQAQARAKCAVLKQNKIPCLVIRP
jgi:hypothetical protein